MQQNSNLKNSTLQNDLLEISDKMCQTCKSGKISDSSQEEDHCYQTESKDLSQECDRLKKPHSQKILFNLRID